MVFKFIKLFTLCENVHIRSFFSSVFSRIAGKYGPEKTPYLNTFYAVLNLLC